MIVSIHQPAYLPWLGYFARIAMSDLHIVLDHVQFEKNSFINRNQVRTKEGKSWLTVPLKTKGKFGNLPIVDLQVANETPWAKKHRDTLRFNYSKAPFFSEHAPFFEEIYSQTWESFSPLVREMTTYFLKALNIQTPLLFSSQMSAQGSKEELVLNLCKEVHATTYLSGPLGRDYLREESFHEANIKVQYHDYLHPVYPQLHEPFEPHLAIVDLLFNCGSQSRERLGA